MVPVPFREWRSMHRTWKLVITGVAVPRFLHRQKPTWYPIKFTDSYSHLKMSSGCLVTSLPPYCNKSEESLMSISGVPFISITPEKALGQPLWLIHGCEPSHLMTKNSSHKNVRACPFLSTEVGRTNERMVIH